MKRLSGVLALVTVTVTVGAVACSASGVTSYTGGGGVAVPTATATSTAEAPTGQRWEGIVSDDGCGRTGVRYVLVDEVCGRRGAGYGSLSLHAPMFRDGARIGDHLFAVDATFLWSLDVSDPARAITRKALLGGLGQPVAVAAHGNTIVVAGGERGLVLVDATVPTSPRKVAEIATGGHALDVDVVSDKAYVALGPAGLGIVDLAATPPSVVRTVPVPGYAAGVKVRGRHAFVAACESMVAVDLDTGLAVGSAWPGDAVEGGVLTAPAKDVDIVGDVAFVAAGKKGAVAIDVTDPSRPAVLGNCAKPDASFYGSGVRSFGDKVYLAAGEWGVLPIDAASPKAACPRTYTPPSRPEVPEGPACTEEPPWVVLPWESLWAPPPPAKDPIQVLPTQGRVFAFGDARRVGTRAVDVRDTSSPALPLVGRYDEPRKLVGIAAAGGRLVAAGAGGGTFRLVDGGIERTPSAADATLRAAHVVGLLSDGRWIAARASEVYVEGLPSPVRLALVTDAHALVPVPGKNEVAVIGRRGAEILDVAAGAARPLSLPRTELPAAVTTDGVSFFVAGPESTSARKTPLFGGTSVAMPPHGVFGDAESLDAGLWRRRLPRRMLGMVRGGLAEVASIGDKAGVVLHPSLSRATLPPGTYDAMAVEGDILLLTTIDRALYRSTLITVSVASGTPEIVSSEVFTGAAAGVATVPGRAFVADADGSIRVYALSGGAPSWVRTVSVDDL